MTSRTELRLSAPLALLAALPGKPLPAQFTCIAYSGGLVPSYGAVIDLASTTVPKSMALLSEHQRDQIVGKVDDAGTRNGQIVVTGALYSDMAGTAAERIAQLAQRGTAFQLSIGLFNFSEEFVPAGASAYVNGTTFAGPVTVMRNGTVRECSVVTLGADPNTSVELFSQQQSNSRESQLRRQLLSLHPVDLYKRRAAQCAATQAPVARAGLSLSASDIYAARRKAMR